MAPNAAVEKTVIQTKGLAGSDHRTVGNRTAMAISTPPIVGVPDFFWCDWGPSSRMYWPIWNSRSFWMTYGPINRAINSAVPEAKAVRNVMKRKMRKG